MAQFADRFRRWPTDHSGRPLVVALIDFVGQEGTVVDLEQGGW